MKKIQNPGLISTIDKDHPEVTFTQGELGAAIATATTQAASAERIRITALLALVQHFISAGTSVESARAILASASAPAA